MPGRCGSLHPWFNLINPSIPDLILHFSPMGSSRTIGCTLHLMGARKSDWREPAGLAELPQLQPASSTTPLGSVQQESGSCMASHTGHVEHIIICVSWIGACDSHSHKEAWKKSQGFGISPGDRPAWGKLAEKQDKGISEHIGPFFSLLECTDCQNRRYHLQKHCTARRFIGLEHSLYKIFSQAIYTKYFCRYAGEFL